MLPHRLILFHRAQEATWKPIPEPSLKLRGRLMSHKAQKPNRTPHLKPPWRQQKTWNPPKTPQKQHRCRPLHPITGRQQQLSNLTPNLQAWQPLPHHNSTRAPNPPPSNQPSLRAPSDTHDPVIYGGTTSRTDSTHHTANYGASATRPKKGPTRRNTETSGNHYCRLNSNHANRSTTTR